MSSSSAKTSSSQQQTTQTSNLNLQSTSGITVAGNSGPTQIIATDQGAVKAGVDIGTKAINAGVDIGTSAIALGRSGLDAGVSVANAGLDAARAAYNGGLSFAGNVVTDALATSGQNDDRIARFATDAIDQNSQLAQSLSGTAISAVTDAGAGVLDFAKSLFSSALGAQSSLVSQDTASINALASQVSQSSQQSVNDAVVKLATIAAIAIAAVFIFKGAK